jgi:hypothetical protein
MSKSAQGIWVLFFWAYGDQSSADWAELNTLDYGPPVPPGIQLADFRHVGYFMENLRAH